MLFNTPVLRVLSDQRESEEMSNRKRMRSESNDEMSTASSSDEGTSKETLSENRMRNESDDETSTAPDEDIFSLSGEEDVESSEEMTRSSDGTSYFPVMIRMLLCRWNGTSGTSDAYM